MKRIFSPLAAILFGFLAPLYAAQDDKSTPLGKKTLRNDEPSQADLDRARVLLADWAKDEAPASPRRLMRIVYWNPADRDPQPEYRARLTRVMLHIQEFYQKEMESWGFPGRTIQFKLAEDGLLKIYLAKGTLKSEECSEADNSDGYAIRHDCLEALKGDGIDGNKETMVIFCNLADWDPVKRTMGHHSPYYASGDNRGGTAWQVDSPLLDAASLGIKDQAISDRQYGKISLGKYNSIFIGGVCHELGHALGLPHCKESNRDRQLRGTALMGSGNRTYGDELRGEGLGSFLTLGHALKLASHPQFSGVTKQIETRVEATFDYADWKFTPHSDGLKVSGRVRATLPIYSVIGYANPDGGGDYDSEIAVAIPESDGSFTMDLPRPNKKDTFATLHFVTVCVNGAATATVSSSRGFTLPCRITPDSGYELSKTTQELELNQYLSIFLKGELPASTIANLDPSTQAIFKRLQAPDSSEGKLPPESAPQTISNLPLSDAAPLTAKTGWGGVHFDRNEKGAPLFGPRGVLEHGLYAHADSVFEYNLDGKWDTFTGQCCLLRNGYGPIEAAIQGDGLELWKSGKITRGETKLFTIKVKGVKILKLEIKGIDGNQGAWGAWGEPSLQR